MAFRHLTFAAVTALVLVVAACAPKKITPEAFIADACTAATLAESSVIGGMEQHTMLASQLEEHQARLVEMQRMKSRIVTGRMSDEELAQWEPELLPWEEPEPEPEPVIQAVEQPAAPDMVPADTMATTEYGAEPDTTAGASEFGAQDESGDDLQDSTYPADTEAESGEAPDGGDAEAEATDAAGDEPVSPDAATEESTETSEPGESSVDESDASTESEASVDGAEEDSTPVEEAAP